MNKSLSELRIGTYSGIETASEDTSIIVALKKFVERRVSALPMVDNEGRLVDIFAKFDVIVSIGDDQLTWLILRNPLILISVAESSCRENIQQP